MLRVKDLALSYGAAPVLEGVSLEVPSGKFVSLVGPSGSGKSSLLRAVIGLQKPSAGQVSGDFGAGEIGILFQDDALAALAQRRGKRGAGLALEGRGPGFGPGHGAAMARRGSGFTA